LAWFDSSASSLWSPPHGGIKANYDVVMQLGFLVAANVLSNSNGDIIKSASKQLFTSDVAIEEAHATLLAVQTTTDYGVHSLMFEGDAINVTLSIQQPSMFAAWNFSSIIYDINFYLLSISCWKTLKVFRVLILEHII
jgi:hypothetical protein